MKTYSNHINELDSYLKDNRSKVLSKVSGILNKDISIHSFHGIIGGKNEMYGKSIRTRFVDFNDFLYSWLTGLKKKHYRQINYYNNGDDINRFSANELPRRKQRGIFGILQECQLV